MNKWFKLSSIAFAAALVLSLGMSGSSYAATTTGTANINATIANTCAINSITSPGTAALTGGVAPSQTSGTISLTCTSGDAEGIAINSGVNGSGSGTSGITRNVKNGSNSLGYQVYSNSGATTIWGDLAGTNTVTSTGTGAAQSFTFYVDFNTPALTLPAGTYSDTLTVTLSY